MKPEGIRYIHELLGMPEYRNIGEKLMNALDEEERNILWGFMTGFIPDEESSQKCKEEKDGRTSRT